MKECDASFGERLGEMDERGERNFGKTEDALESWIRKRVWSGHGCVGLYGDDGEMQCNNIERHGRPVDFKRIPLEMVFEIDTRCSLEAASTSLNYRDAKQLAMQGLADALKEMSRKASDGKPCWCSPRTSPGHQFTCRQNRAALDAARGFITTIETNKDEDADNAATSFKD